MTLISSDFWPNQRCETCSHRSDKGFGHPIGSNQWMLARAGTVEASTPSTAQPDEGGILSGVLEDWEPKKGEEKRKRQKKRRDWKGQWVRRANSRNGLPRMPLAMTQSLVQGNDFQNSYLLCFLYQALNCGLHEGRCLVCSVHHHKP